MRPIQHSLLIAGFVILCLLVVASVFEFSVPPSARYLVVMLLAFSAAAGGQILGREIDTRFNLSHRRLGRFAVRAAGSAALFVFVAVSGYVFYIKPAEQERDQHRMRQNSIGVEIAFRTNDVDATLNKLQRAINRFSTADYSSEEHLAEEQERLRALISPTASMVKLRLAGRVWAGPGAEATAGMIPGDPELGNVDFGALVGMWWAADDIRHQIDLAGIMGNISALLAIIDVPNDSFVSDGGSRNVSRFRKNGIPESPTSQSIADRRNRIGANALAIVTNARDYLDKVRNHPDVFPILQSSSPSNTTSPR